MAADIQMFCYLRHKKLPRAMIAVCVCIYGVMFNDPPLVSVIIDTDSGDSQDTRQAGVNNEMLLVAPVTLPSVNIV